MAVQINPVQKEDQSGKLGLLLQAGQMAHSMSRSSGGESGTPETQKTDMSQPQTATPSYSSASNSTPVSRRMNQYRTA